MSALETMYGEKFYHDQVCPSLVSARIFLSYVWSFYQPKSALDAGCGRGAWLMAAHELGANELIGLDGHWNAQDKMIDQAIEFKSTDLNQPFNASRVDLAMSLEVAEHLPEASAKGFVASLTNCADVVLFGAAFKGQWGVNHINEQPQSYWVKLFSAHGFDAFDIMRPKFWNDSRVCFWYRQNTFLYAKQGSAVHNRLLSMGHEPVKEGQLIDFVHFDLVQQVRDAGPKYHLQRLWPSLIKSIKNKLNIHS